MPWLHLDSIIATHFMWGAFENCLKTSVGKECGSQDVNWSGSLWPFYSHFSPFILVPSVLPATIQGVDLELWLGPMSLGTSLPASL